MGLAVREVFLKEGTSEPGLKSECISGQGGRSTSATGLCIGRVKHRLRNSLAKDIEPESTGF